VLSHINNLIVVKRKEKKRIEKKRKEKKRKEKKRKEKKRKERKRAYAMVTSLLSCQTPELCTVK
jgi:hypothetical protein